jgi:hypothetical protein
MRTRIFLALLSMTLVLCSKVSLEGQVRNKDTIDQMDSKVYSLQNPSLKASPIQVNQTNDSTPGEIIDGIKNAKSWGDLLGWETAIYSFLLTLGGYLTHIIPGLNNINSNTYRVLTFAILAIVGVSMVGLADVWEGIIAYLFSTGLYNIVLKWFIKTPTPIPKEA